MNFFIKSVFVILFLVVLMFHVIILKETRKSAFKEGYEAAVEDFHQNKLKMKRVEVKKIEYKWIENGDSRK